MCLADCLIRPKSRLSTFGRGCPCDARRGTFDVPRLVGRGICRLAAFLGWGAPRCGRRLSLPALLGCRAPLPGCQSPTPLPRCRRPASVECANARRNTRSWDCGACYAFPRFRGVCFASAPMQPLPTLSRAFGAFALRPPRLRNRRRTDELLSVGLPVQLQEERKKRRSNNNRLKYPFTDDIKVVTYTF